MQFKIGINNIFLILLLLSHLGYAKTQSLAKDIRIKALNNNIVTGEGTGALINVDSRLFKPEQNIDLDHYFIITAAHISKGAPTEILINQTQLGKNQILGRAYDFFNDVEIFEVKIDKKFVPLAELQRDSQGGLHLITKVTSLDANNYFHFSATNEKLLPSLIVGSQYDYDSNKVMDHPSFIFFPAKKYTEYSDNANSLYGKFSVLDILQESSYGNTLFTPYSGLIAPGMSGAPLIQFKKVDNRVQSVVDGLAIQYYRSGAKSIFTNSAVIIDLIGKYIDGARGAVNGVTWVSAENGSSYREVQLCNSTKIANKTRCLSIRESAGIQSKVPSDDGGVRGDGSDGKYQLLPLETAPAPLMIDNEKIYGFKVSSLDSRFQNSSLIIEANWASIDYFIKNRNHKKIEFIKEGFNYVEFFLNHFSKQNIDNKNYPLTISYNSNPSVAVLISKDKDFIEFKLPGLPLNSKDGSTSLLRDELHFKIDKAGEVTTYDFHQNISIKNSYQPVIRVKSYPSNTEYYVDIRQLFFFDVSEVPKNYRFYNEKFKLEFSNPNPSIEEVIEASYFRGPIISVSPANQRANSSIIQIYLPVRKSILNFFMDN